MSFLPPWIGLLCVLLCLGGLAAWVVQRGLRQKLPAVNGDVQSQVNHQIHQQHLADLDRALSEDRLNAGQHQSARDELLRHVLDDDAQPAVSRSNASLSVAWRWIVVGLVLLSGLSYVQLGAPQTWWTLPLSQRVKISATTPEQLAEQTRQWLQTTQKSPKDAEAWLTLARLHAAQNAHALAEQALAQALNLAPEPELWIERAQMKALSAGGVYAGEPWQWIEDVLRTQPQHLNALVLAGSAALSEKKYEAAKKFWQQALSLVPANSEAADGLQQAVAKAGQLQEAQGAEVKSAGSPADQRLLIQGEVRVSPGVQSQIGAGAIVFVYALAQEGSRRPVAIWRGTAAAWPVRFALSDSMGMGAPPLLSSLAQVRLVARISKTGSAQKQEGDFQVELPGVQTGVQGVVLTITGLTP